MVLLSFVIMCALVLCCVLVFCCNEKPNNTEETYFKSKQNITEDIVDLKTKLHPYN